MSRKTVLRDVLDRATASGRRGFEGREGARRAATIILAGGALGLGLSYALVDPAAITANDGRSVSYDAATISTSRTRAGAWGYHGSIGPDRWAILSDAFVECIGEQQSPVDLADGVKADTKGFELDWDVTAIRVTNNGHSLQLDPTAGGAMRVAGKTYHLRQFHFHAPSEHAINGERAAMEIHFVHVAEDGSIAMLAVLIGEGVGTIADDAFATVMSRAPSRYGQAKIHEISPKAFLPKSMAHFRYQGSLTTPPCSETVLWTVLREPVRVSPTAIESFKLLFGGNARPLQPMNRRYLLEGE